MTPSAFSSRSFFALSRLSSGVVFFFSLLLGLSSCKTVGSFYNHPLPASYYVKRYCFELPRTKVQKEVLWLLREYNFPILQADEDQGLFITRPVQMSRYGRRRDRAYVVGLRIQVTESRGKLSLKGLPAWALRQGRPPLPSIPQRSKYPSLEAYLEATSQFQKKVEEINRTSAKGVALMRRWQGCNIHTSTLRTAVQVQANIVAYPYKNNFGQLDKSKPTRVRSDLTLEYSILRVLGWRLGRLRFMRPMLYRRR